MHKLHFLYLKYIENDVCLYHTPPSKNMLFYAYFLEPLENNGRDIHHFPIFSNGSVKYWNPVTPTVNWWTVEKSYFFRLVLGILNPTFLAYFMLNLHNLWNYAKICSKKWKATTYLYAYLCAAYFMHIFYSEPLVTLLPWATHHILTLKSCIDDTLIIRGVVFNNVDKPFCPHI